jgi:hypothetical protein
VKCRQFIISDSLRSWVILTFGSDETSLRETCGGFKGTASKQVEAELTRDLIDYGFTHIDLFSKSVYRLQNNVTRLIYTTHCIQGFTEMSLNFDADMIKFPGICKRWRPILIRRNIAVGKLTNEITKSARLVWSRSLARACSNSRIAPS